MFYIFNDLFVSNSFHFNRKSLITDLRNQTFFKFQLNIFVCFLFVRSFLIKEFSTLYYFYIDFKLGLLKSHLLDFLHRKWGKRKACEVYCGILITNGTNKTCLRGNNNTWL